MNQIYSGPNEANPDQSIPKWFPKKVTQSLQIFLGRPKQHFSQYKQIRFFSNAVFPYLALGPNPDSAKCQDLDPDSLISNPD
jgi:hypothetical protein